MDFDLTNYGSYHNGITGKLVINSGGTLDGGSTYSLDVRSQATLYVCGTLIVRDQTFSNGSYVTVCSGGNLTVNGTLENKNNSQDIFINGTMTVNGPFINDAGGEMYIGAGGKIVIPNGPFTNTGSVFCNGSSVGCSGLPCSIGCTSLPVELLGFGAKRVDNKVFVDWTTASEINNDYFIVQKSYDAKEVIEVARVKGSGNSTVMHQYSSVIDDPFGGLVYYRLCQVDYDGTIHYYPFQAVKTKSGLDGVTVFPNPSNGSDLFISYIGDKEIATISINDISGKEVFSQSNITLQPGINQFMNGSAQLAKGTYFFTILLDKGAFHQRLIIN